jgi:hypothetical protein
MKNTLILRKAFQHWRSNTKSLSLATNKMLTLNIKQRTKQSKEEYDQ